MPELYMRPLSSMEDFRALSALAASIWKEHFTPILPPGQTEYMLEKFQSAETMLRQTKAERYQYYQIEAHGHPAGYFAIQPDGNRLFLSKLYVQKAFRGQGFSSAVLDFIQAYCRKNGFSAIWLTVNRYNERTIAIYQHFGFQIIDKQATDIGGGYVMDDYFMELSVKPSASL